MASETTTKKRPGHWLKNTKGFVAFAIAGTNKPRPGIVRDTANYMATTLADLLRDFSHDIQVNEHLDPDMQKDPELILLDYLDMIKRRIIGD